MLYLSMDVGTSAVKASVVDDEGRERQTSSVPYPYRLLPGEKVEIDPDVLLAAIGEAAGRLDGGLRAGVDLVCYDTFSPSLVLMGASGGLVHPGVVTHLDRRSRSQSARVVRDVGAERFLGITGLLPFVGGCGLLPLLWFQENAPEVLARVGRVGHLTTYLHHWLTGEWTTDRVNASMFGAYRTVADDGWSGEVQEAFGLDPAWFPPVNLPGTVLGALLPGPAALLGLRAGVPVTVGTNDMAAAQVGAGNEVAGAVMNTAGSSEMVSILTDVPAVDPRYYLRCAALPGLWQIYATTAGGFALDWFHAQLARELADDEFYGRLLPAALDEHGATDAVRFSPYLTGDRQSLEVRHGQWSGLTLATTREEMLAAMVRAMVGVLADTLGLAARVVPLQDVVKVSGGLAAPLLPVKRALLPGFGFEVVRNCSILGNVRLAQRY